MERVAVAGLSLHHADVDGVERVQRALAAGDEPPALALADRLGASEVVCLATCNRLEVIYARENGHAPAREDLALLAQAFALAPTDELCTRLFLHSGERAARHLFRVACSLDSLVLGEDQILAQVRAAWAESQRLGLAGAILTPLFEQAIQVGKRVRSTTDLSRHPVSVVSLGVAFLVQRLRGREPRIAVLGAGATGAHAARALRAAGLPVSVIANRTLERAQALAAEVGARAVTLAAFQQGREPVDALVTATSAPEPILDAAALRALAERTPSGAPLVAVDLAIPRDLAALVHERLERIDLESLRAEAEANRARRSRAALEAELLVEEQLAGLQRERAAGAASGTLAGVLAETRERFELELTRLEEGRLAHLDERDREAVRRWARAAFGRLAHAPLAALKRLARAGHGGENGVEWEGHE